MGIKLTQDQATLITNQMHMHVAMNNADATQARNEWLADPHGYVESLERLLDAGHPYLTQIVIEITTDRLSKI